MRPVLILTAAILIAYANSFQGEFLFDSYALVVQDTRVHQVSTENVQAILTSNYWGARRMESGLYRPVTTFSYLLNYQVAGASAWAFHAVNLLLHLLVALLAFLVVSRIASASVAFWAVLIWGVHPINTEAVTNIAGRPELLAAACVLGGFLVYQRSRGPRRWKNQIDAAPASASPCNISRTIITVGQMRQNQQRHIRLIVALFLITFLGVFSKESAAVLLGLVLLYDWHQRRRPNVNGLLAIGLAIVLRAVIPFAGVMAHAFVDNPEFAAGFWVSRFTALEVMGRLIRLWCWPATLSADYSFDQIPLWTPAHWQTPVFAGLIVAGLVMSILIYRRSLVEKDRDPRFSTAIFWALFFFVAILPSSNLVIRMGSIMAERFLYLPGLGLAVLAALGITRACGRPRRYGPAFWALALVAIAFGARTWERNRDWTGSPLRFWEQTAQASPKSFKPKTQLAGMYWAAGRTGEAIEQADQTVKILGPVPDRWNAYEPYAEFWNYYQAEGRGDRAEEMARRVAGIFNAAPKKSSR